MAKKHAFVKYTKKGKLIPGSLVITESYPKETANGVWEEVPMNLFCCDPITTTTIPGDTILYASVSYPNTSVSVRILCNDVVVDTTYSGYSASNLAEMLETLNTPPHGFIQYGVYSDGGDGQIKLTMPYSVVSELCPGGTISFEIFND